MRFSGSFASSIATEVVSTLGEKQSKEYLFLIWSRTFAVLRWFPEENFNEEMIFTEIFRTTKFYSRWRIESYRRWKMKMYHRWFLINFYQRWHFRNFLMLLPLPLKKTFFKPAFQAHPKKEKQNVWTWSRGRSQGGALRNSVTSLPVGSSWNFRRSKWRGNFVILPWMRHGLCTLGTSLGLRLLDVD